MRAILPALALAVAGGFLAAELAPERQPAPQRQTTAAPLPADKPSEAPPVPAVPWKPPAPELLPIRAAQPGGLPGQVTLTVQNGLPGGMVLNAAPIGAANFKGWAGFDAARNCTHFVYLYDPFPGQMSSTWFYGIVRGNGLPASLPGGAFMGMRLEPRANANPLPLLGGFMVGRPELPFSGAVAVQ